MFSSRSNQSQQRKLKQGINADDSRKKREENCNEIRKSKREESLQKRRFATNAEPTTEVDSKEVSMAQLPQAAEAVKSADPFAQLEGTTIIRKLLSIGKVIF